MKSLYALAGFVALGLPATALAQEIEGSTEIGLNIATSSGGNAKTTASIETEQSFGGAFIAGGLETLYQDPTDSAEITLTLAMGSTFQIMLRSPHPTRTSFSTRAASHFTRSPSRLISRLVNPSARPLKWCVI